ncbi:protein GrpE [Philodulcilactobacillus myokoensis]|uniref:Protein GrpE n=1 Tax=Philodulcilactobacillus myokoensis TaxID=2929573 RepID=A0A9W6B0Z2_9LACO|nr:nucleotide exchange factor GrpE [Philodulcilactobacillus myokoensis]GLB46937.1 protein GrpE [Philodulcilactobacillus myokoensis]
MSEKDVKRQAKTDDSTSKQAKSSSKSKSKASTKKVDAHAKEVADLKKQLDSMENRYLRAEADMKNIQRHAREEQADLLKYDGQKLASNILPVVDNLKRAMEVKVSDKNGKQLKQGVQMVYEHLNKALSDNNVKKIEADGKKFDPKYFQAVQSMPAKKDQPHDQVVKVLQDGYQIADRVLRPAMVIVSK